MIIVPSIKILLIIDDFDFDLELDALKMSGIITEKFEQQELTECINTIASGRLWFRRIVIEQFITDQQFLNKYRDESPPSLPSFTKRELEIIQLVVNGKKNKEIGNQLFLLAKKR